MGSMVFNSDRFDTIANSASSDFTSEHASRNLTRSKGVRTAFNTPIQFIRIVV
jgi:hypothetical protein